MTIAASFNQPFTRARGDARPSQRATLVEGMRRIAAAAGARHYLVADLSRASEDEARIVACNWPFDIVTGLGAEAICRFLTSPVATFPGARPQPVHVLMLGAFLTEAEISVLSEHGDENYFAFKLAAGNARFGAILSAAAGQISEPAAARAQLRCCHLLSDHLKCETTPDRDNPLSLREIDCLRWVSQGKTTEEVAVILGVSANTINSYITQSINKLAASNRAMATAIALREGLI